MGKFFHLLGKVSFTMTENPGSKRVKNEKSNYIKFKKKKPFMTKHTITHTKRQLTN
jgi:hypothetical protein